MLIGNFIYDENKDVYTGDIKSLNFWIVDVIFEPNAKKGEKEPDYRITAPTENGHVDLGAGWKRESEKGHAFVSVSLDGPLMDAPVSAALFPEDNVKASLVWNRPKAKSATATKRAA